MAKAYSYVRFSTPEQAAGDSQRRQIALARRYAEQNGLELDEGLTIQDLGVSAFRGANAETGRLGEFLEAVRQGMVPKGSYLLVESLDRISRQSARKAVRKLEEICEEGITVVTLSDGQEYTLQRLEDDPMSLIMSLLIFMRGNEESTMKQRRNRAAWEAKRARGSAGEHRLTRICPGWLQPNAKGGFDVIPERRDVIRRIFRMALKGTGQHTIAATLNAEKVKPFKGALWHRSYIAKTLSNPAVIGTFTPHTEHHEGGKLIRKPQEAIEGYYPAIIKEEDYRRVQAMRSTATPQRGRHAGNAVANILGGLVRCPRCGSTMTLANKSGRLNKAGERASYRYFVCTKAKAKAGCKYTTVPYEHVENALLMFPDELTESAPDMSTAEANLRHTLKQLQGNLEAAEETLAGLLDTAAKGGGRRPAALVEKIEQAEEAIAGLREQQRGLEEQLRGYSRPALEAKLGELEAAFSQAEGVDRAAANTIMRQLFSRVTLDYPRGRLVFAWQHGGETEIEYGWLAEGFKRERAAA